MRIILTILILLLVSPFAYAQQADKVILPHSGEFEAIYTSKGMINGHHWRLLPDREKQAYLLGYEDGVINTAIYYLPDEKERKEVISNLPTSVEDTPMDNLVKRVDEFYSDERNLNIPMPFVLLIIRNRLTGVAEKEIDEYIEHLRNSFSAGIVEGKTTKAEVKEMLQAKPPTKLKGGKVWKYHSVRFEPLEDGKVWAGIVEHTLTFDDNDVVKKYSVVDVTDKYGK